MALRWVRRNGMEYQLGERMDEAARVELHDDLRSIGLPLALQQA